MKRTVRNIIILVGVLAALGLGFWWLAGYEPSNDTEEQYKTPEQMTVYEVDAESISAISVTQEGDMAIRYTRWGEGWTVGDLSPDQLSQSKLESFVNAVSIITSSNKISDSAEDCGFDTPSVTVTVEKTDGTRDIITVGDMSAVLDGYFLRVNDGEIYNVSSYKIDTFRNDIDYYRTFSRLTLKPEEIFEVKIEREKNTLHIQAKTESDGTMTAWEIAAPFGNVYNANDTYISENILTPMEGIDISTPAPKDADTGLKKPKAVVTVKSAAEGEETTETVLKVGNTVGDRIYVEYEGEAYEADAAAFSFVDADEFLAVSKLLALTNIATLTDLTVNWDNAEYLFEVAHTAMGEDDDEMTFKLNGKDLTEKDAKALYQEVIGIPAEGKYNGEALGDTVAELKFTSVGAEKLVTFSKLNDMYAAYTVNGVTEFTVKLSTVEKALADFAKY